MSVGVNLPISALPVATLPLGGVEPLPVVQAGVTSQVPAGQFGQVVAKLDAGTQNANVVTTTIYRPTDRGHLCLLVFQMSTVKTDAAAGDLQLEVTNTDQGGPSTFSPGVDLDLTLSSRVPESFVVYVAKNTPLQIAITNSGIFATATYAYSYAVLQLT